MDKEAIGGITQIKDTTANPAPLGLMGFGMTTVPLNTEIKGSFAASQTFFSLFIINLLFSRLIFLQAIYRIQVNTP